MKKTLWALSAMALIGFGMVGCGDDDECVIGDPSSCDGDLVCAVQIDLSNKCVDHCTAQGLACGENQECKKAETTGNWVCLDKDVEDCPVVAGVQQIRNENGDCVAPDTGSCQADTDCEKNNNANEHYICNMKTHMCEVEADVVKGYTFVRIDDASDVAYTLDAEACKGKTGQYIKGTDKKTCYDDPGADIDAIVLTKAAGGEPIYATEVYYYKIGDVTVSREQAKEMTSKIATNPNMALKKPDSFNGYPANNDKCLLYVDAEHTARPFVSLGGKGGVLIVQMGGNIEAGDKLDVLELGGCEWDNGIDANSSHQAAVEEEIEVFISIADDIEGTWKSLGKKKGDKTNKGVLSYTIDASMLQ